MTNSSPEPPYWNLTRILLAVLFLGIFLILMSLLPMNLKLAAMLLGAMISFIAGEPKRLGLSWALP